MGRPGLAAGAVSTFTRLRALVRLNPGGVLDAVGRAYQDRPLLFPDEPLDYPGYGTASLTGGQLRSLGHRLAHALQGLGVRPNTRVVIAQRNHPVYLLHMHAVILAGGIPVSVNAATGAQFLADVTEHTGAALVLTDPATISRATASPAGQAPLRRLLQRGVTLCVASGADRMAVPVTELAPLVAAAPDTPVPARRVASDTVVAMFHTSGTTGTPKLCVWNGANSRRIWKIMMATLPAGARTRLLVAVPFSHALFFALGTGVLLCGARLHAQSDLEPERLLHNIARHRATSVFAFPHLYMRAVAGDLDSHDLSSVKIWATGADKAHAAHIAQLTRRGGLRLAPWLPRGSLFLDSYGSTEIGAGGIMQLWPPGSTPQPCLQGTPMPTQFAYRIVDEAWRDVPAGTEGRILVRSTTAFAGYWNNHDRWVASRVDGWWWAGDVGCRDRRGRLLFLDREADSVHTAYGVLRTLPVEERLLAHPQVMEAAVFQAGRDPDGLGHAVALVAPRGALKAADLDASGLDRGRLAEELREWANTGRSGPPLAAVRVVGLDEIPFGVTGKVLKTRLREAYAAGPPAFHQYDRATGVPG